MAVIQLIEWGTALKVEALRSASWGQEEKEFYLVDRSRDGIGRFRILSDADTTSLPRPQYLPSMGEDYNEVQAKREQVEDPRNDLR